MYPNQNFGRNPAAGEVQRKRPPNDLDPTFGLNKRGRTNLGNIQSQQVRPSNLGYIQNQQVRPSNLGNIQNQQVRPSNLGNIQNQQVHPFNLGNIQNQQVHPFNLGNIQNQQVRPSNLGNIQYQQVHPYVPNNPSPPAPMFPPAYARRAPPQPFTMVNACPPMFFESPYFYNPPPMPHPRIINIPGPRFERPPTPRPAAPVVQLPYIPPLERPRRMPMCILTGTVEKVIQWAQMCGTQMVMFEVIGVLDYVRPGFSTFEKTFMMKDSDSGPVLQVVFYEIDRSLGEFEPGSLVKVQGMMKGRSRLQAYNVVKTTPEELAASQHVIFICDRAAHDLVGM